MYTLEQAIEDHQEEYNYALELKSKGTKTVSLGTAPIGLCGNRKRVPIDEYIQYWKKRLDELQSGNVDPEDYNY